MQLIVRHKTEPELVLPINYHHILQAIICHLYTSPSPRYVEETRITT